MMKLTRRSPVAAAHTLSRQTHMRHIAALAIAAATLAACGGASPTLPLYATGGTPIAAPGGLSPEATPTAPQTAVAVASDTKITVAPKTYSLPSDACYGLETTTTLKRLPPACESEWIGTGVQLVPGNDAMNYWGMPKTAYIAQNVPAATGSADATAFYKGTVLQNWFYEHNSTTVIKILETAFYINQDRVYQVMKQGGEIMNIPTCYLPDRVRITKVPYSVQQYFLGLGWPQPSGTAAVVNYAACPGLQFAYEGGGRTTGFGNSKAGTAVITGHIESIAPFGDVWVIDGYGLCGETALKVVCGS